MIPTAQELYDKFEKEDKTVHELMVEFAKLHVQEALKQASEKAKIDIKKHDGFGKQAILNSYPLTNIK